MNAAVSVCCVDWAVRRRRSARVGLSPDGAVKRLAFRKSTARPAVANLQRVEAVHQLSAVWRRSFGRARSTSPNCRPASENWRCASESRRSYNKLIGYAVIMGFDVGDLAMVVANAHWLIYVLGSWQPAQKAWGKAATDGVREAQTGTSGATTVILVFTPPAADPAPGGLPTVVPQHAGALPRIFKAVQDLLENDNCIGSIRTDLRIVGAERAAPDLGTVQPVFTARTVSGQVLIDWNWGGNSEFLDLFQLQVNRGAGWVDLAYDTTPGYTDTTPFPAAPAVWKYRGQYRVGDDPVGVWSNEVSVTVGDRRRVLSFAMVQ